MAKNKLTKGTLSLGQIEKDAMPEIKSGLKKNEKELLFILMKIFTARLNAKR